MTLDTNLRLRRTGVLTPLLAAAVWLMSAFAFAPQAEAQLATAWQQDFSVDDAGWSDSDDAWYGSVAVSGGKATMTGDVTTAPFSGFDMYRDVWPGDWMAEIDVYLDPAWPTGEGFDYSVAANGSDGAHQRDYIFHVGTVEDEGDVVGKALLVNGSNNADFTTNSFKLLNDNSGNYFEVTTAGWYTLQHVFYNDGGSLSVDLNLLDSGGTVLWTATRSNGADTIPGEVGGNRYGWFTHIDVAAGIMVDNHELFMPECAASDETCVTPDAIFGSGNANGSYTIDRDNSVELGLRGKLRHNGSGLPENTFNSNGDGTYSFNAGVAPTQSFPTAEWSFEWSINTDFDGETDAKLADYNYMLMVDSDPGAGTTFLTFDPIHDVEPGAGTVCWDHSMGDNSTGNGDGVEVSGCRSADGPTAAAAESEYASNIAQYNVAQNSWKAHWFIPGFDPTVEGWYDFELVAKDDAGAVVASTWMQIIVGDPELTCAPESLPSWDGNIAFGTAEAEVELDVPNGFKSIEIMPSSNNIVLLDVLGLSDLDRTGPLGSDFAPGHSMIEYTGGSAPTTVTALFGPQTQAGSRFMFRVTDQAGCELQVDPQVDLTQDLPREVTLHENYPNPFNPSTTISFDLPERADVHLSVYDAMGRRVSTLASGSFDAGTHDVSWNGTDAAGAPVASGIYFYRFEAGTLSTTKQMILLK